MKRSHLLSQNLFNALQELSTQRYPVMTALVLSELIQFVDNVGKEAVLFKKELLDKGLSKEINDKKISDYYNEEVKMAKLEVHSLDLMITPIQAKHLEHVINTNPPIVLKNKESLNLEALCV